MVKAFFSPGGFVFHTWGVWSEFDQVHVLILRQSLDLYREAVSEGRGHGDVEVASAGKAAINLQTKRVIINHALKK